VHTTYNAKKYAEIYLIISSMYLNLGNASKSLPRSSIFKPSKSSQTYLILNIRSEYWIPKREAQEEKQSGCLRSNGTITLKKKQLGKLNLIFSTTFQTSLEPNQVSNLPIPFCSGISGRDSF
jgi:hypothetical protein